MTQKTYSLDGKNVVIFGGTGTLGKAVIDKIYDKCQITVFSRDELKQKQLKNKYPKIRMIIGDIRDRQSVFDSLSGKDDVVFNFSALKHVDIMEDNVSECIKTNLLGTINVAEACHNYLIHKCVFSSTDKAVLPINAYGMAKGLSEKYLESMNRRISFTEFKTFRWGNVVGSRGSILDAFIKSLEEEQTVYITDAKMTRFWIDIDDASRFMLDNLASEETILIPPMKASSVLAMAEACAIYLGVKTYKINYTGIRPGEKIHECLYTSHDHCLRSDTTKQYSTLELVKLIERALCQSRF